MSQKPKLLIFDGNAIVHRSFHALPLTLTTRQGELVNAVYGFAAFVLRAIKELKPTYAAVAFDLPAPTFRHQAFAAYKATRVKAPQELYDQMDRVKQFTKVLGLPIFELAGFEADDLIGTIASQVDERVETIIVTGDQDTMQLINDSTFVYTMSRGFNDAKLYGTKEFVEKYKFLPQQMIDYKALRGDPSDNIPGIKGIGEKTASQLVSRFGDLQNIYHNLKDAALSDRLKQLIVDGREQAELSRRLATIDCRAPVQFKLSEAALGRLNEAEAIAWLAALEFHSLLPKLREMVKRYGSFDVATKSVGDYHLIAKEAQLDKLIEELQRRKYWAVAYQFEKVGADSGRLLSLSFSWQSGQAYCVPLAQAGQTVNLFNFQESFKDVHPWLLRLAKLLAEPSILKTGYNLKSLIKLLGGYGLTMSGVDFDVMLAAYLLSPDNRQLGLEAIALAELAIAYNPPTDYTALDQPALAAAAGQEADMIYRLTEKLQPRLEQSGSIKVFKEIEMPLIEVLAAMENAGVALDSRQLDRLENRLSERLEVLSKKIWQLAGRQFNIASVKQLREVLFDVLNLSVVGVAKKKTGLSTGAAELEKLKAAHPIVSEILEWRELSKLSTTYARTLPELINRQTGRLHTNFNQMATATGRLSSSNPNLQNIPARSEWGKEIRRAFIAAPGKQLLSLDYSQIELRLAAHLSMDPTMLSAFNNHEDIHTATAAAINNLPIEQVSKELRQAAKAINFGLLYGQGPKGLAETAGLTFAEAKQFIAAYFNKFNQVKGYIEDCLSAARRNGYVETLLGRRRYLPDINSENQLLRKAAERMAINTPLQGTAADIIKLAMIDVSTVLENKSKDIIMILQVHDELVFEGERQHLEAVAGLIKRSMEAVLSLRVPLEVEAKIGDNWEDMNKLSL